MRSRSRSPRNQVFWPAERGGKKATRPCPCGYATDPRKSCKCTPLQVERYLSRISGPLLDRIDIHVEVPGVPFTTLRSHADGTPSSVMREQVLIARARQHGRFVDQPSMTNARMSGKQLREYARLDDAGEAVLRQAINELGLSARAHDKVLRVARTIADLAQRPEVLAEHVMEAVHYRRLDRRL